MHSNDLVNLPLFEFSRICASFQKVQDLLVTSYAKAVKDLLSKVKAKEDLNEKVDGKKVAEGLDRIRTRLLDFRKQLQFQREEMLHHVESLAYRLPRLTSLHSDTIKRFKVQSERVEDVSNSFLFQSLVANFFLQKGCFKSLQKFCAESHCETFLTDLPFYSRSFNIYTQLENKQLEEALAWCEEFRPLLKSIKSKFEFHLRLYQFYSLRQDPIKAVEFARSHLFDFIHEIELQHGLLLLLHPSSPTPCLSLHEEFKQDLHKLAGLSTHPFVEKVLWLGLCLSKTTSCVSDSANHCPGCHYHALCEPFPFMRKSRSIFVCRLSEKESETVLVFPNGGQAYSVQGLEKLKNERNQVIDPITKEVCKWDDLKRAFLL